MLAQELKVAEFTRFTCLPIIMVIIIIIVFYGVGITKAPILSISLININTQVLNCIHEQVLLVNYVASNRSRSSAVPFQAN